MLRSPLPWCAGLSLLLAGCIKIDPLPSSRMRNPGMVTAYVPVYASDADTEAEYKIAADKAQPTVHAGKIFTTGKTLYQVEDSAGVHIIDYTDREHPFKTGFIRIPGCRDVAFGPDSLLVANNHQDLVTIDMKGYPNIRVVSRKVNVFPVLRKFDVRPPGTGYFQCPEAGRKVTGWEQKTVNNPQCWQ
ncbi:hypothetical protein ACWKWU_11925 [Chitinophaga lutea]